ncbi:catenin delta-1 isoform X1 [Vulpes vulpes]|uniref:Catenin delta 1 n=3 Tax=Canidae TaxID=9608 RepID=A0A8C0SIL9_CANLF|nr:catenin delta-1 isoform X1 [Canis lupus familiaris]XP_022261100.1 catenin delta-1 isoform X1 [Canis lupus familiaris]XP_025308040.1 catenin delta-1 isoform X1 [Canis lupus dingo]XP_025308041.1 catenin delta-1 isoform X1 [Canis lupus dingo]XP_025868599.1 catenin delta-1 isoform X1 [Vulpes vulpes]XP_025868600.1 catenin delta-1 isoform X1 [Vulpes vulpes]XP_035557718.1 catenin delta-1 isoform X1 [Canis lupus dingo]XP_038280196.1 catenin delta-1 isoform X1 [Canis lupus familiaris]XP_038280198|eukprot:XP_005631252.1 catenin delta-1 isoform X1 [Canis lupus familiaris]
MDDSEVESTASILASVKEQEAQFEKLTRALEEERRHVSAQLERVRVSPQDANPLMANGTLTRRHQNGRFVGDADLERQKFPDLKLNGPQDHSHLVYSTIPRMQEPGQIVETYTEEDPEGAMSVVSVETSDDGTTRRTETTVKKVVKTVTTRTVQPVPVGPDGLPVDASSVSNNYIQTLGRDFRKNGNGGPGPYVGQAGTATLPRNFHYPPDGYSRHYEDGYPGSSDNYGSLSRVTRIEERYRPSMEGYRAPSRQDVYGPQPQVRVGGSSVDLHRFHPEPYGLEDDQRSMGYDDLDYGMMSDYGTARRTGTPSDPRRRLRSYEDMIGEEVPSDQYYWAPLAQHERGSLASLDSLRKGGPPPPNWRQPELPEVIAMLGFRLDAVKSNAAAYLQHLCYRNDKVKTDVRKLKGIPVLVGLLDHPKKEVHLGACGALKNISFGRDQDNKIAIKNCDGVPALVRLLRKARDMDLTEVITGTLWNLSSHDSIKMEIVDHALHALTDEVIIPHSGWEREPNEDCKPRHIEWESVLTNTAGCLRNVSSERSEARRKLRECDGLVDALIFIVQAEIGQKDSDSKLVENCVCLLRNLSYQVHREIPQAERYQEAPPSVANNTGPHAASCFGAKKGKDEWFSRGKKPTEDPANDTVDFPKRTSPARGYELLFQPEVVRIYISLLKESKTPAILEASAGAIQNLCAGRWTYGRYIRSALRQEKALSAIADLLTNEHERVVKAASGALRNLAVDARNKELIGKHAIPNLVKNLPGGQQSSSQNFSEDTVVSLLNTINEVIAENLEAAKKLRETQGIEKLVLINKSGNRSEKEVRAAALVLQTIWGYKELRKPLEKEGWKKSDFQVNLNNASRSQSSHSYDDTTLPLIDRNQKTDKKPDREEIQMSSMGSNTKSLDNNYSTLNERGDHNRTLDRSGDLGEMEPLKGTPLMQDEGQESLEEELDVLVLDDEGDQVSNPSMQKI